MEAKQISPTDVAIYDGAKVAAVFHSVEAAKEFCETNNVAILEDHEGTRHSHQAIPHFDGKAVAENQRTEPQRQLPKPARKK